MRLLQVVLAAGLFASHAVAWPRPSSDYDYSYDDDYYYNNEPSAESEPLPAANEPPEAAHDHHQHHSHGHHNHMGPEHGTDVGGDDDKDPETLPEELDHDLGTHEHEGRPQDPPQGVPAVAREEVVKAVAHGIVPSGKIPSEKGEAPPSPASSKDDSGSGGEPGIGVIAALRILPVDSGKDLVTDEDLKPPAPETGAEVPVEVTPAAEDEEVVKPNEQDTISSPPDAAGESPPKTSDVSSEDLDSSGKDEEGGVSEATKGKLLVALPPQTDGSNETSISQNKDPDAGVSVAVNDFSPAPAITSAHPATTTSTDEEGSTEGPQLTATTPPEQKPAAQSSSLSSLSNTTAAPPAPAQAAPVPPAHAPPSAPLPQARVPNPVPIVPVHQRSPQNTKSCTQPPDPGMCRGSFPKFYYDPASRSCLQFVYGGCRGNANVFQTAQECYEKCDPVGFTRTGGTAKDDFLKLHDGRGKTEFTFPGHSAAIRVNDATLAEFSVRNLYQLEFTFRTDSPHGLIAFLRQSSVPPELGNKKVQLYVFIRRGHLAVTHIFCHNTETFLMKRGGLQAGNWHSAMVKIDAGTGQLLLEVDGTSERFTIRSLQEKPHYGASEDAAFTARLWIGGVFREEERNEEMVERIANFRGCMQKIGLMSGETSEGMVRHKGLRSITYRGVRERCNTNCQDRGRNMCSSKLSCVEHFDHSTCSCFGTGKDGRRCEVADVPILTLNSDGHVVHRLYEWMDRVHSYTNFISMEFRTRFTDSILFYGSSHYPEKQYIGATLTAAGSVFVEANLGGGAVNIEVGERLETGTWHTLTILHQHNRLQVHLNSRVHELLLPGEVRYFHLDPDFYFGSAPQIERTCGLRHDRGTQEGYACQDGETRYYYDVHDAECHSFNFTGCGGNGNNFADYDTCMDTCFVPGLRSMHSFLGCMKNVFINDVSVLWELKEGNKTTRYVGPTEETPFVESCNDRGQMVLLTLSTERSHVNLTNPSPESFRLAVSFRPTTPRGVVASGWVDILDTRSQWEIHHDKTHISFVIHDKLVHLKPNTKIEIGSWQYVEVTYNKKVMMTVNQKRVSENPPGPLTFDPAITLGLGSLDEYPGMVGCVRKVELGGERVDLRSLVGTNLAHKDVTYDGCRVLGPCDRPSACEHGTTCTVGDDEEIQCNCTDSGYTGKTCFFSTYKSSCEEYRQIGYNTSGVYKIDVDGNGPLPPAFVRCEFNPLTGVTSTIVENNLREKYEVRRPGLGNVKIDLQYRDFTHEMLKALVTRDETCTQKAEYECRRSPLKLSTHTWFESPSNNYVTKFGSKTAGLCRCGELGSCDTYGVTCNCDANDGMARFDKAVFSGPEILPITSMVFLAYEQGQREESEGRITLGPLTCSKGVIAENAASFSAEDSYLEVPAWREGSLAFSFKTTSRRAILAYQPAYHPDHATFRIALLGDKELEFTYIFHELEHRRSLHTTRRLNTGAWQQVVIDMHLHQLRFLVNSEQLLIDIEKDANLGVLDGSLFLGGMPGTREEWVNQVTVGSPSLRGCIRDLTVNHEIVDLERYVRAAPTGVSASCKASCEPNPCKNGASCVENWGSYECVCKNTLAHSGKHCEINPNEDAITFTTEDSKLKYFENETANLHANSLLNSTSLLFNFRTHATKGLILFTYDYLHNFLQLHLASPTRLVLLYNSGKQALFLPLDTENGETLNRGQSVQVSLERTESSTTLSLLTNGELLATTDFHGLHLLKDEDYEQFPFGESTPLADMVYYPHSFTRPGPFYKVYFGSADDPQWDVRTDVSGFVGCVRGLKLNSAPVSLSGLLAQHPAVGVKKDCMMVCDRKPCLNGGVCKEDFQFPDNFRCDCSGTSYTGPVCNSETAYTFRGREWLSRGSDTTSLVEGVVLELAFSASTRQSKSQVVAFLRSTASENPRDYILVSVEPDGTVGVSSVLESLEPLGRLVARASPRKGVNAYSGLRHVARVEWQSAGLRVTVDGMELEVTSESMPMVRTAVEPTLTPRGLYLGGLEPGVDGRLSGYDNFHGCISNVMVSLPGGKVYPLQEYSEHDLHITNHGLPGYGSCSGFPAAPVMVMAYHNRTALKAVSGESWQYREALGVAYAAPAPVSAPERNSPMDNVVPAVSGAILLVVGVVVSAMCVKSISRKKKKDKKKEDDLEEKKRETQLREKKLREQAMIARAAAAGTAVVEMTPLLPKENGGPQDLVVRVNEKQEAQPLQDQPPPPPAPVEDAEEDKSEVQTPKGTPGLDRALSWDKSADALPLIIGTEPGQQQQQQQEEEQDGDSASSEESSLDYTVDITGSPSSSPKFPPPPGSSVGDASPSSMRVHRGSIPRVNDEDIDAESEPRLLRHSSLPGDEEPDEEPPAVVMHSHPLLDGEVQKIEKSEAEDEIVVVDDYLDDKEAEKAEEPGSGEAEQQMKDDLAEADQESSQTDSDTEAKTDQSFESAKEEQEDAKESGEKETDDKSAQEGEAGDKHTPEEGKKTEAQTEGGAEAKQDEQHGDKKDESSSSSDDDFVKVLPEGEKEQDATATTSQTWQENPKNASTTTTTTTTTKEDNQEDKPPIAVSSNKETDKEEEKVKEETANEEVKKQINAGEVVKVDRSTEYQSEVKNQEHEAKKSEDDGKNEISGNVPTEAPETEFWGTVPTSSVPEIIVSSPQEEPEQGKGYFLTQIKAEEGKEGVGEEVSVQDSQVSKGEDNQLDKGSSEATRDQDHSVTQEERKEKDFDKVHDKERSKTSDSEAENSSKQPGSDDEVQTQQKDDIDISTDDRSDDKTEGLGRGSDLPPIDMSQLRGQLSQADNGPASPLSDGGGLESPSYLNYVQDDDVYPDDLIAPAGPSSTGNVTPLDRISEEDESEDEKDGDKTKKTSLPTLFMSKFSSGMANLTALAGDGEAAQGQSSSDDEAQNEQYAEDKNAEKDQSSSDNETQKDEQEASSSATPVASKDAAQDNAPAEKKGKRRRRRKKGRIVPESPQSPIFLREGVRTFSNPISYLGGPSIKYDEEEGEGEEGGGRGGRQRNDSVVSTASLD